jgi:cysteine-rich repeat protein
MRGPRYVSTLAVSFMVSLIVLAATPAHAASAGDRCGGLKTKGAARYAKGALSCQADAVQRGEPIDAACLAKSTARLATAFAKAELPGGCVTADDESAAASATDAFRDSLDALLAPAPDDAARACAAAKTKAVGRCVARRLGCYGKSAVRGMGPGAPCLAMATDRLAAGFTAAEAAGGCTTMGDTVALRALADVAVSTLVRALSPVCGDAIAGPTQACEPADDAGCPGHCSTACACVLPPVCGDGVAELPEECDDGNVDDNDGCSASCVLENEGALCAGVRTFAGTAINAVLVSNDFEVPLYVTAPRLDPRHLFVVEREGYIRLLDLANNTVQTTAFLDLHDLTTTGGERGLLSMAFDPAYEQNRRFYVSHTNTSGDLVLARYETSAGNPGAADESTRQELLVVPHPGASNHNGGQLQFRNDGYLYWSMGDGGEGVDAQNPATMLGKLLRIDVHHDTPPLATVPPTNPYYVDGSAMNEYVWAVGLRNPWRFSFDRATGDLYIGDVGAGSVEEVDFTPAAAGGGQNYGWNTFEGSTCHRAPCPDPPVGYTMPVFEYPHIGGGCAVMGGYAYRGCALPAFAGTYFFSALCSSFVKTFEMAGGVATNITDRTDDAKSLGNSFTSVLSWGEDARGEIYVVAGNNGVYRVVGE